MWLCECVFIFIFLNIILAIIFPKCCRFPTSIFLRGVEDVSNSYLIKTISFDPLPQTALQGLCSGLYVSGFDPLPLLLLYKVCVAVLSAVTALQGLCSGLYVSGSDSDWKQNYIRTSHVYFPLGSGSCKNTFLQNTG